MSEVPGMIYDWSAEKALDVVSYHPVIWGINKLMNNEK